MMNMRLLIVWTARHDNGWTTLALEREDGAFSAGAAPPGVSGVRLEYVEDGPEHAKIAAEFDLEQKTGHERCSANCSGWEVHTHEVDVPTPRRAARLLVIDPSSGAVLLFQYEDDGRRWWATPGGALDGDETFEEAATREAREELGLSSRSFLPLWRRTVDFSFRGTFIRQEEHYFLLRIAQGEVTLGDEVLEAHRHEGIIATRWWSLHDIEATSEQVFPEDLAQRLRELRFQVASTGGL